MRIVVPVLRLSAVSIPRDRPGCMHDQCPSCGGTGRKVGGGVCYHALSCPCRICTPGYQC